MSLTPGFQPGVFFTGERSGATGLQYLRARWYDPSSGRFTQVDPFAGVLELPGTQHPYAYGLNNPLTYTDPSGKVVGIDDLAILGGIVLVSVIIAAVSETAVQMITSMSRGASFEQAFDCLDWGKVAGAALSAGTATLLLGGAMLLFFPAASAGAVLAFTTKQIVKRLAIYPLLGAASNVMGDVVGRRLEYRLNGHIESDRWIRKWESYGDDVIWGSIFGALAGFADIAKNFLQVAYSARFARAFGNLPTWHGRIFTPTDLDEFPLQRLGKEDARIMSAIEKAMPAIRQEFQSAALLTRGYNLTKMIGDYVLNSTAMYAILEGSTAASCSKK